MSGPGPSIRRQGIVVLMVGMLLISVIPGLAAAQSGVGGSIVVAEGDTVSEVNAVGGSVVVHGTVTGDVSGAAGSVLITGSVGGDVAVATGNLRISGDVGGDVAAGAGSIHLEEGSHVGGSVSAGAGEVRLDGTIDGDVRLGAETIRLGETAAIAGSLTYDGRLDGNRDAVAGDITRDRTLGATTVTDLQPFASWAVAVYVFIANLVLGGVLLALFPRFSRDVAEQVMAEPLKTGVVGLGLLLAIPVVIVALLLSIVGIPFAFGLTLLFAAIAWIGTVYGRFALGAWLLSFQTRERFGGVDRSWVALVLGVFLGAVLTAIPIVGGIVSGMLLLIGVGALGLCLYGRRRVANGTHPDL